MDNQIDREPADILNDAISSLEMDIQRMRVRNNQPPQLDSDDDSSDTAN